MVPTNLHTQTPHAGIDGMEAEISGCEIEFFIIGRVVGNVHLAIFPGNATILFKHHSRVVIESGRTAFEERCYQHDAVFLGHGTIKVRGASGNGFGKIEVFRALHLTKVKRVVQFLKHHKFGSTGSHIGHIARQFLHVLFHIGGTRLLNDTYLHILFFIVFLC